ncbi:MAG TPA: PilZ domain-containing protein [Polyangia bacterium]|nr:PilZ domain-containing protein [Polyangia bacterium]
MGDEENRVHARIHVSTTITVASPEGNVDATLRDLSKGGARFVTPKPIGRVGETIELFLPSLSGEEITVMAEIIRSTEATDGCTVAVRFDAVDPAMRQPLNDLIEVLLTATGGGQRASPRVSRRMDIRFGHLGELRAILEDISRGGLAMTVADALVLYEELEVTVPDTAGDQLLILRARVVHQRAVEHEGEAVYRVGLEFANLRIETRRCLNDLLKTVLESLDGVTDQVE